MKRLGVIAVIILLLIAAVNLFTQKPGNQEKTAAQEMNKLCPVMGGPTNKKLSYQYKDRKYYFCCPDCIGIFQKDPEKYIKNLNKATAEDENIKQPLSANRQYHKVHKH